jgi:hypothetical protein
MSTTPGDPHEPAPQPDPLADPSPDQVAMGLRLWVRRISGAVLLAALLTVIVVGICVSWQESRRLPPLTLPDSAESPAGPAGEAGVSEPAD